MNISNKTNIFNIPANYSFFDSFCCFIDEKFGNKQERINDLTIIFPNKRSCREFDKIFTNYNKFNIKPNFKAISEINIDDFYKFFNQEDLSELLSEIKAIKKISNIDYLFFLSEEISKTQIFKNVDFLQSFNIAISLKNIFDDIEKQDINIEKIYDIDDSNLSAHRQFSLDFLKEFYVNIKNKTLKNNIFNDSNWQNFIVNKFAEMIEQKSLKSEIIIAGSTGSVSYSRNLINSICQQDKGYLILYGLSKNNNFVDFEKSPQFILSNLLQHLKVDYSQITEIKYRDYLLSSEKRIEFIESALIASEKTYLWNEINFDNDFLNKDFNQNLQYIEAENEIKEAKLIVEAIKDNNKKTAIIINSDNLAQILKSELKLNNIAFNDARSISLKNSKIINLLLLIIDLYENNFASDSLLSILKHPLVELKNRELISEFEIKIIRQQRSQRNIDGIKSKLESCESELKDFFADFYQKISHINFSNKIKFSDFYDQIILAFNNLTNKDFYKIIKDEDYSEELLNLLNKLKNHQSLIIKSAEISEFFYKLFSSISYFEEYNSNAKVNLISTIEARLLNFDLLIVSSLNYGDFPQIKGDNWLGKKIRKSLEIDFSDKKYGQNLYDFCNYFCNKSVILTRSKYVNGSLSLASPLISRLLILWQKIGFSVFKQPKLQQEINFHSRDKISFLKLEKKYRPKTLAATDLAILAKDPYQIYAKKILKLKELQKIDYEPSYKEFGSFIHKILEEFVKSQNQNIDEFMVNAKTIFSQFFISDEAKIIWWPKFENIFNNFLKIKDNLVFEKDYLEISGEINISDIKIKAKIDRFSLKNQELQIFDYKTGQIPSKKDIISGLEPQLLIYGLILSSGSLQNKITTNYCLKSLNYIKLSAFSDCEIKIIFKDQEIEKYLESAKYGLKELLDFYQNEESQYKISLSQDKIHEYSHLERVFP